VSSEIATALGLVSAAVVTGLFSVVTMSYRTMKTSTQSLLRVSDMLAGCHRELMEHSLWMQIHDKQHDSRDRLLDQHIATLDHHILTPQHGKGSTSGK